ncbi:antigen [Dehalogenimonas sp. WBC-2]|nr:antigen [Dehalogenimonas sp. WBC-2]
MEMNLIPASRLKVFDVINENKEDLGQVQDFMIDATSGRVAYAVVAFGGILGFSDKWFAMPMESLCWSPENNKFIADISREKLEKAPGIDKNKWPSHYMESKSGWLEDLYNHFNCKPYWATATPNNETVNLGQMFKTGHIAPVSGVYRYVSHSGEKDHAVECIPSANEMEIPVSKGETLPPVRSCGKGAMWRLIRLA